MKRILIFFVFSFLTLLSFAKGSSGTYYIKGTAYLSKGKILKNTTLTITIGEKVTTISTDEKGTFEIEIPWVSACPSLITKEECEAHNKKMNPEFIYIDYGDATVKLENKWKQYGNPFPKSKKQVTWKKDVNFTPLQAK